MSTKDKFKSNIVSNTVGINGVGLSPIQLQRVFPYHVAINSSFLILQTGSNLSALFENDSFLIGKHISDCFDLITPNRFSWDWNVLVEDSTTNNSHFELNLKSSCMKKLIRKELKNVSLRGDVLLQTVLPSQPTTATPATSGAIFLLHLNISTANELKSSGYKLSDIQMYNMQKDLRLVGDSFQSEFTSRQFQKQLTHDLKVKTLELESAKAKSILDSKKSFIRYISHELRNPLNISLLGLNLLEEQLNDSNMYQTQSSNRTVNLVSFTDIDKTTLLELISDVKNSNIIATEILNDLLLYEKIDNHELNLELTETKPSVIIKNVVKLFKSPARQSNIQLDLSESENLDQVYIHADICKLSQVLRNLLSNALKFTPNGGHISVSSELICSSSIPSSSLLSSAGAAATSICVGDNTIVASCGSEKNKSSMSTSTSRKSQSSSSKLQILTDTGDLNLPITATIVTTAVTSASAMSGKTNKNNNIAASTSSIGKKIHFADDKTYIVDSARITATAATSSTAADTTAITTVVDANVEVDDNDNVLNYSNSHSPDNHSINTSSTTSTPTRTDAEITSPFTSFCVSPALLSHTHSNRHSISRTVSRQSNSPPLSKSPSSSDAASNIDNTNRSSNNNTNNTNTTTTTTNTNNNTSTPSPVASISDNLNQLDKITNSNNNNQKNSVSSRNSIETSAASNNQTINNNDSNTKNTTSGIAIVENNSGKGRARKQGSDRARSYLSTHTRNESLSCDDADVDDVDCHEKNSSISNVVVESLKLDFSSSKQQSIDNQQQTPGSRKHNNHNQYSVTSSGASDDVINKKDEYFNLTTLAVETNKQQQTQQQWNKNLSTLLSSLTSRANNAFKKSSSSSSLASLNSKCSVQSNHSNNSSNSNKNTTPTNDGNCHSRENDVMIDENKKEEVSKNTGKRHGESKSGRVVSSSSSSLASLSDLPSLTTSSKGVTLSSSLSILSSLSLFQSTSSSASSSAAVVNHSAKSPVKVPRLVLPPITGLSSTPSCKQTQQQILLQPPAADDAVMSLPFCSPSDVAVVAIIDGSCVMSSNNSKNKMNCYDDVSCTLLSNNITIDENDVFDTFNADGSFINSHLQSYSHNTLSQSSSHHHSHVASAGNFFPSPHNSPRLGYNASSNNNGGGGSCIAKTHMTSSKSGKTYVTNISNHSNSCGVSNGGNNSSRHLQPDILRIYVKDTGIGLSKATQKTLFEEFSNCRTTASLSGKHNKNDSAISKKQFSTDVKHGSGLGLWVARSIMEAHKGSIGVYSEGENIGKGSIFFIDIPIFKIDPTLDDSLNMSFSSKSSKNISTKSHFSDQNGPVSHSSSFQFIPNLAQSTRSLFSSLSPRCLQSVLVVDDAKTNRKMLVRLLQGKKIAHIEEAVDGADAIEQYKNSISGAEGTFPYDVIMMDFVMPVMDGPTATQQLRSLGYKGLIVGVTGNSLPSDVELFLESGANKVMIKPLDIDKFMTYASCWIQRSV